MRLLSVLYFSHTKNTGHQLSWKMHEQIQNANSQLDEFESEKSKCTLMHLNLKNCNSSWIVSLGKFLNLHFLMTFSKKID